MVLRRVTASCKAAVRPTWDGRRPCRHVSQWTSPRSRRLPGSRQPHHSPSSDIAYELRSVAVPYGGCTERSNVKAAGSSCPIRFQCAGCGFYRPDHSYLPAIEQHINELRADREAAGPQSNRPRSS
ncbi:hypothetical protein OV320_1340 [Actinobacteria bacterium OV320]|nr:hypothetical protein OV320_1340 [Actinobacteria bacterium OV320]